MAERPAGGPSPAREWDAATYHRVSGPQLAWGRAVLERVRVDGDEVALDAGCGSGRLTAELLLRLPRGRVVGVDLSHAMLVEARRHLGAEPRCRLVEADIVSLPVGGSSVDLVLSTATFHWVLDHDRLFAELARVIRPGGRLVAQCGGAGNIARAHATALAVLRDQAPDVAAAWAEPWEYADVATTERRLTAAGFEVDRCELVAAPTPFHGPAVLAEFLEAVVLRPFLARLDGAAARRRFLNEVVARAGTWPEPWLVDYVRLTVEARRRAS